MDPSLDWFVGQSDSDRCAAAEEVLGPDPGVQASEQLSFHKTEKSEPDIRPDTGPRWPEATEAGGGQASWEIQTQNHFIKYSSPKM